MTALRDALAAETLLLLPEVVLLPDGPTTGLGVLVQDGRFAAVTEAAALVDAHPHLAPVTLPGTLLMPGFVDAHTHLAQAFGKSLVFGEPSEIFRRIWVPLEGSMDDEAVYLSAKLAALEALRGGFTTVVDAGVRSATGLSAVAQACTEAGLRCVLGAICNDAGGAPPVEAAEDHLAAWPEGGLIHPSLAISIPEAATDGQLRRIAALCAEAGAVFQTHANEHVAAVERSLVARGRRPIQLLGDLGVLGPHVLLAHATLLTADELLLLRDTGAAVAYNPVASAWKGNAVAPALTMAALGIPFGIGTDSTRGDAFRLLDMAEAAQRLTAGLANADFSTGGGWLWLDHAMAGGARAAGLGAVTGRIAPGLAADFLLLDLQLPEMQPSWDLPWELVRLAGREQIVASFVAGRMRLFQGWPVDWDGRALMRQAAACAARAVAAAPIHRVHPTTQQHRERLARP